MLRIATTRAQCAKEQASPSPSPSPSPETMGGMQAETMGCMQAEAMGGMPVAVAIPMAGECKAGARGGRGWAFIA